MAEDEVEGLRYDLRKRYANIVASHIELIAESRIAEDYYNWLKGLENLHTIIKHKFKKAKDEEEYIKIKNDITSVANKNANVWLKKAKDPIRSYEIESTLRKLEEFLFLKMDEAGMFGKTMEDDGL